VRWAAHLLNEAGRRWQDRGRPGVARAAYASAALLAPSWSAPWFNLGLMAKSQRRWSDSLKFNRRAAELDPDDPPAWWNLGIAATAIGQWTAARLAWTRYGIEIPPGEGPIEMDLGAVPIRLSPAGQPEVVWCRRIDPARAVVLSIPTAGSGRGCGDLLLHDGEPTGSRLLKGRNVPVFDELELLAPGKRHTFAVEVLAPRPADLAELETGPDDGPVAIEDWSSSLQVLCADCSRGTPHDHPQPATEWTPQRRLGVAAESEGAAVAVVRAWAGRAPGRELKTIECVLERREGPPAQFRS
jgi:hypothetical protein